MKGLFVLSILSASVFLIGCNEGILTLPAGNNRTNVHTLRPRAIEIVRNALRHENSIIRSIAIEVVSTTGSKKLMPTVTNLLKDPSFGVRFAAAMAVGDMSYSPGKLAVGRTLNDKNENVRLAAAFALTKLGRNNLEDIIRKAMISKDQTVRANTAMLLGKLGNKQNLELLYWTLRDADSSDRVKIQTIESIAMLGDEWIYQKRLWPLLISKYADDRVMGIKAMGALGTEDAKNAILTMLYDEIVEVRLSAAEQLGRLGDTSGQAEVVHYFTKVSRTLDAKSADRANVLAAGAIGRIGGDSMTRFLPKLLDSRSKQVQLTAAQAVLLLSQ